MNDLIEVNVLTYHEILFRSSENELLWDPLQGGPKQGSLAGGPKMSTLSCEDSLINVYFLNFTLSSSLCMYLEIFYNFIKFYFL